MSESFRLYQYQRMLSSRRAIAAQDLANALEISPATLKRDLAKMRDYFGMPIVFDRDQGGYKLLGGERSEIPGMWFSPEELVALMTVLELTTQLQPGLMETDLEPLKRRLADLLRRSGLDERVLIDRLLLNRSGQRTVAPQALREATLATVRRKKLAATYCNGETGECLVRTISPQRIVLHQGNWHLDAWCHLRGDMRSFSIDGFAALATLDEPAHEVSAYEIHAKGFPGYGSFYGKTLAWAHLRFAARRARRVAQEQWHRDQKGEMQPDGSYDLLIP